MRVRDTKIRPRRRPRRILRRMFGWLVKGACLLAMLAGGAYLLRDHLGTERYTVQSIVVDGTRALDPNEVALSSGVTNEDLLFLVDVGDVAARVEKMPYVRECQAKREFPDTVYIDVKERVAVATILVNNRCYAIDEECVPVCEVPMEAEYPGPLITSVPGLDTVAMGQALPQVELAKALAVWRAFSATQMAKDVPVSEIAGVGVNDIRMYCQGLPFEIRWGRDEFDKEAQRLDALWRTKGKALPCSNYLDLRFGRDLAWQ